MSKEEEEELENRGGLKPSLPEPPKWLASFHRDLMAGAVMGGVVHTIVAPIERAKLLLQTQESNLAIVGGGRRKFKGMLDCIFRTVREEGILSLWRGNGSSVLRYYPSVALNFSLKFQFCTGPIWHQIVYRTHVSLLPCTVGSLIHSCQPIPIVIGLGVVENGNTSGVLSWSWQILRFSVSISKRMECNALYQEKDLYRNILRNGNSQNHHVFSGASANFIAGAAAGCTTLILIYPLDIAHTRLAADVGRTDVRQFRGIYHFLSTIHKKDGIQGIYRGLPASLQGMVVHRGLYFGGFDTMKEILAEESKSELALWKRWVVAQGVTTSAGLLSYPLDTVRRRMMMQSGLERPMYHSTLDCWKTIYRTEGLTSFYRGAVSNIFRSTGAAAILVLYDEVKKFMNWGGL
ncbi:Mitochondrial carrier protein [Corchorus olitorius]|uniref:ADP/ATP translocase n=1 Tax=Corchorus olitorius TaxID=93759 RepID=A0A1R3IVE6_9ROSI|nr:Mitochondrial carrier protein [Corchorus olitorius]